MNAIEVELVAAHARDELREEFEAVKGGCECGEPHAVIMPVVSFVDNTGDPYIKAQVMGTEDPSGLSFRDAWRAAFFMIPQAITGTAPGRYLGAIMIAQQCHVVIATDAEVPSFGGNSANDPRLQTALAFHIISHRGIETHIAPMTMDLDGNPIALGAWRSDLRACKESVVKQFPFADVMREFLTHPGLKEHHEKIINSKSNDGEVMPDA